MLPMLACFSDCTALLFVLHTLGVESSRLAAVLLLPRLETNRHSKFTG